MPSLSLRPLLSFSLPLSLLSCFLDFSFLDLLSLSGLRLSDLQVGGLLPLVLLVPGKCVEAQLQRLSHLG